MAVITFNPKSDKSGLFYRMLYYPADGVAYNKVNGSYPPDESSIYTSAAVSPTDYYQEMFDVVFSETIPADEVITSVKLIARVTTANTSQLQRIGVSEGDHSTIYYSSEHSGTTGYVNIDYTWAVSPVTGVAWTKSELEDANFFIVVGLKQSNPAANFNQCTRFYGEVTTAVPSTFIPKIMIS